MYLGQADLIKLNVWECPKGMRVNVPVAGDSGQHILRTKKNTAGEAVPSYGYDISGVTVPLEDISIFKGFSQTAFRDKVDGFQYYDPLVKPKHQFETEPLRWLLDDKQRQFVYIIPGMCYTAKLAGTWNVPVGYQGTIEGCSKYASVGVLVHGTKAESGWSGQYTCFVAVLGGAPVKVYMEGGFVQMSFSQVTGDADYSKQSPTFQGKDSQRF